MSKRLIDDSPNRDKPDAAQNNVDGTGDVYEFKHVPNDNVTDPGSVFKGLISAVKGLRRYIGPLNIATPGITWRPGSSWMPGFTDWGPIASADPRIVGRTDPGDHLVTVAAYGFAPGALAWASVSAAEEEGLKIGDRINLVLYGSFLATAFVQHALKRAAVNVVTVEALGVLELSGVVSTNEAMGGP